MKLLPFVILSRFALALPVSFETGDLAGVSTSIEASISEGDNASSFAEAGSSEINGNEVNTSIPVSIPVNVPTDDALNLAVQ
ncbi:hypothetical protein NLG97_g1443 [Lecanicillium saksenae]|uniref:Uncharacterized protein n=1 Tax=Lecanicillium saksenae TaxID=468837 RepID=A0ACC1R704_9HYPO|nr:hypothetical protein NLG97_g1443 [Lecanicillium saksenae]